MAMKTWFAGAIQSGKSELLCLLGLVIEVIYIITISSKPLHIKGDLNTVFQTALLWNALS